MGIEDGPEPRPYVLLVVDRTASQRSAEAEAATVAAALDAALVAVGVGGSGTAWTVPHAPANAILDAAEQLRPAVIVLPSPVHPPAHPLVAGSVTDHVIQRAVCPVLLVPVGGDPSPPAGGLLARIVLAVDASTAPEPATSAVARLAEPRAEIIVLHVHEVDRSETGVVDDRIESVVDELQAAGFRVGLVTSHAMPHTVADDIAEVAREVRAGMIVVGRGNGPRLAGLLHGVSVDVLRRAPCPVLVEP